MVKRFGDFYLEDSSISWANSLPLEKSSSSSSASAASKPSKASNSSSSTSLDSSISSISSNFGWVDFGGMGTLGIEADFASKSKSLLSEEVAMAALAVVTSAEADDEAPGISSTWPDASAELS
ncbi:hypothetical protein WICMUC_005361 [Wickerhamomyces mucosus]|uniref:Uncharacterized protein n=1 Tax=Wickerhamomyces mucosus TaxID=1378264 RepID=A0A9P8P8R7_9ASCO|nr:hypothetical protein WICMUC_005361 [Wickerhamomyces mucosus]